MTTEEKAKAYDEALEQAREMLKSKRSVLVEKQALVKIFPELRESEDEEKRKRVIECLKLSLKGAEDQNDAGCDRTRDIEALKWGIAYLEKQKSVPALDRGDEIILKAICEELKDAPGWVERIEGWYQLAKDAQQSVENTPSYSAAKKYFDSWIETHHDSPTKWGCFWEGVLYSGKLSKPVEWTGYSGIAIDKTEYSELTDAEWAILRGFARVTGCSHFPITIIKETAQDFLAHLVMISEVFNENK